MYEVKATYTGTLDNLGCTPGREYVLYISNGLRGHILISRKYSSKILPYSSIMDFLSDWDNIKKTEN